MRMKNDFHIKGWAPTLILKQRPGGTRKWPIGYTQILLETGSLLNTVPEFGILFQEKVAVDFFFWSFLQNEITGYKMSHSLYLRM